LGEEVAETTSKKDKPKKAKENTEKKVT